MKRFFLVLPTLILSLIFVEVFAQDIASPKAQNAGGELATLGTQIDAAIRASRTLQKYGFEVIENGVISSSIGLEAMLFLPVYIINNMAGEDYQIVKFKVRHNGQEGALRCTIVNYRQSKKVLIYACDSRHLTLPQGVSYDRQYGISFGRTTSIASFTY